jgi:Cytochrome c7 and related cytochrome c
MPRLFRPYADTLARSVLVAIVVVPFLAGALVYWVSASEHVTGQSIVVDQPVPFSHAHHVGGLGIDCRYCHTGVETSATAGIPPTHTCMTCHSQLYTQAAMLAPIRESLANDRPIHWNKVNKLPGYAYFDHSIHIAKGIGCTSCHGSVADMPLMLQAASLTMGWCLDCHRNPAPQMRPLARVFDPHWQFPDDQAQRGVMLAHQYLDNKHLSDCSVCHR